MDIRVLLASIQWLLSPFAFAGMVALATVMLWLALAPARGAGAVRERLGEYVDRPQVGDGFERSFWARAVVPLLRRIARVVGRLAPRQGLHSARRRLLQAGEPGRLTVLEFAGARLLLGVVLGIVVLLWSDRFLSLLVALRNGLVAAVIGFLLPALWLTLRIRRRRQEIQRSLPDALDMLTIGVEAGLAFESALLRVNEHWDNALTREFQRSVAEMRVGTPRDVALKRIVERTGVTDLATFIAVLIQSRRLGVSIAQVLHSQASQMRIRRRQRAEEVARQASLKLVFVLLFFVFPSMLVVILGPSIPAFQDFFSALGVEGGVRVGRGMGFFR